MCLLDDPPSNTPSQRSTGSAFTRPAAGNNYFNNRYPRNRSNVNSNTSNSINRGGNSKSYSSHLFHQNNSEQGILKLTYSIILIVI